MAQLLLVTVHYTLHKSHDALVSPFLPSSGAGASADDGASRDQVTAVNVAKECLLAAVKADPKAAHIWTNLADAYYITGDYRSSSKCLEKAGKLESNCLATRYAVAVHRIRDAERSQNPKEQLSWAGNEMASILREGDSLSIEAPVAWAGLAMVHKAQHEIAAGFDIEQHELVEVKERALYSLKQGMLDDGQMIAAKRLSENSSRGLNEFKNEVSCIGKLQHRNLVTLLGCCIEKGERILIYEYMPNKSLDFFIFDEQTSKSFEWLQRYNIINGIARGLLYLHGTLPRW